MVDLQSMQSEEIIAHVVDAGKVDFTMVQALQGRLNADWVISEEEAELLFTVNKQVGHHEENCPTWEALYIDAITKFLVFDMHSPGEVSEAEAQWLTKHLAGEALGPIEVRVLNQIQQQASKTCESLEPLFAKASLPSP